MDDPNNGSGWMDCVPGTGSPEGVCIKRFWAGRLVPEGVPNKNKGACIKNPGAESGPVPLFFMTPSCSTQFFGSGGGGGGGEA